MIVSHNEKKKKKEFIAEDVKKLKRWKFKCIGCINAFLSNSKKLPSVFGHYVRSMYVCFLSTRTERI